MEETSATKLKRVIAGFELCAKTYIAANLDIPDLLTDGPKTASKLAKRTNTGEGSPLRVLRYLALKNDVF